MKNEYIRHTLATIHYRFQKTDNNTEEDFGNFSLGKGSRTPKEIINHMYYVLSSTKIFLEEGRYPKEGPEKLSMKHEVERFNTELKNLDDILAIKELKNNYTNRLLQGPLSDILTHIGQIAMLCRLNGDPIKGEDFSSANIQVGFL